MAEGLMEAIGQDALTQRLARHAEEGSLAHAMLLTGAPGRGGLALALNLARRLHCQNPGPEGACGVCPSCQQHDQLQHPDLHFSFPVAKPPGKDKSLSSDQLDVWRETIADMGPHFDMQDLRERMALGNKQPFISVHEAADILRRLSLTAHAGGWKVQVIWGAHMMRVDTANKLLKLLEEPPKRTLFVLLADNTEALLATILSRTRSSRFRPPAEAVRHQRNRRGTGGHHRCRVVVRRGLGGSAAPDANGCRGRVRHVRGVDADVLRPRRPQGSGFGGPVPRPRAEPQKQFLAYALHMVRQCIVGNYGAKSAVRLRAAEAGFAHKFAAFIHHGNVVDMQSILERAAREVAGNVYGRTVFLDLSMRMMELLRRPK